VRGDDNFLNIVFKAFDNSVGKSLIGLVKSEGKMQRARQLPMDLRCIFCNLSTHQVDAWTKTNDERPAPDMRERVCRHGGQNNERGESARSFKVNGVPTKPVPICGFALSVQYSHVWPDDGTGWKIAT
jgi:hypothetical protein